MITDLKSWLKKNKMKSKQFQHLTGLSKQTIWKLKNGSGGSAKTFRLVYEVTKGQVVIEILPIGRPRLSTDPHDIN